MKTAITSRIKKSSARNPYNLQHTIINLAFKVYVKTQRRGSGFSHGVKPRVLRGDRPIDPEYPIAPEFKHLALYYQRKKSEKNDHIVEMWDITWAQLFEAYKETRFAKYFGEGCNALEGPDDPPGSVPCPCRKWGRRVPWLYVDDGKIYLLKRSNNIKRSQDDSLCNHGIGKDM